MTFDEKLAKLKAIYVGDEEDSILSVYLENAGQIILNLKNPFNQDSQFDYDDTQVPQKHEFDQIEIAICLLAKRGAEGETSHSENGVSRQYGSEDIPLSLKKRIVSKVGVPL